MEPVVDAVLVATVTAVVAFVASRSRRWSWLVASAVTAVGAVGAIPLLLVAAAVVLAVTAVSRGRSKALGAVVGGLVANAALRLDIDWFFGASTVIGVAGAAVLVFSGWRHLRSRYRRRLLLGAAAAASLCLVGGACLGLLGLSARNDAATATREVRAAFDLLSDGDAVGARRSLLAAEASFRRVEADAGAWWAAPARLVPVVAQHRRTIDHLAMATAELSGRLADATAVADIEAAEFQDGRLDLAALGALLEPAESAVLALERAESTATGSRSGWLLPPVADRVDEAERELTDALRPARLAAEGARLVPELMGRDGLRSYVVLFANPAETRELGGFVGALGVLAADSGRLSFAGVEPVGELSPALQGTGLPPVTGIPATFAANRPDLFPQNWSASPDLATVAKVVTEVWPRVRPEPVDGVLYVDPYAVSALLELTGPVTIPEIGQAMTADNVVEYVLRGQYEADFGDGADSARKEALADLGEAVFQRLTSMTLPGPRGLADALGPAVAGRHLQLWSSIDRVEPFLSDLGLDRSIFRLPGDVLHLAQSNSRAVKLDAYLTRSVDYEVAVDRGVVRAEATVRLRNEADPARLPGYVVGQDLVDELPPGTNRFNLTLYTPWELVEASQDGEPAAVSSIQLAGLWQHTVVVTLPPATEQVVTWSLAGAFDGRYTLSAVPFAGAVPDHLSVVVAGSELRQPVYSGAWTSTVQVGSSGRSR